MRMLLILVSVFAIQNHSFASSIGNKAMQAALDARNEFVTSLQNKDYEAVTHQGFDIAVQSLAQEIRDQYHDDAMAEELLGIWGKASLDFSARLDFIGKVDLGDHDPLFPQIEEFLKKLAARYGSIIYSLPIVKDVQMLNYAIPVVFSPHGSWQVQGANNRVEYRKHFIPFANLVTYYVALFGCNYVAQHEGQPDLKKVCKKVAEKLQFVMGRYIAPVVSDWIFKASNRAIQIGQDRLRYNTVDDLRQAIQQP